MQDYASKGQYNPILAEHNIDISMWDTNRDGVFNPGNISPYVSISAAGQSLASRIKPSTLRYEMVVVDGVQVPMEIVGIDDNAIDTAIADFVFGPDTTQLNQWVQIYEATTGKNVGQDVTNPEFINWVKGELRQSMAAYKYETSKPLNTTYQQSRDNAILREEQLGEQRRQFDERQKLQERQLAEQERAHRANEAINADRAATARAAAKKTAEEKTSKPEVEARKLTYTEYLDLSTASATNQQLWEGGVLADPDFMNSDAHAFDSELAVPGETVKEVLTRTQARVEDAKTAEEAEAALKDLTTARDAIQRQWLQTKKGQELLTNGTLGRQAGERDIALAFDLADENGKLRPIQNEDGTPLTTGQVRLNSNMMNFTIGGGSLRNNLTDADVINKKTKNIED